MATSSDHDGLSLPHDPIRALLVARSCPEEIVRDGFPGLIARWAAVVSHVEMGYASSLDEYINDMDLRDLIQAAKATGGSVSDDEMQALQVADSRFLDATDPSPCVWGSDVEAEDGLSGTREWWYYRRPGLLSDSLHEELLRWGLA